MTTKKAAATLTQTTGAAPPASHDANSTLAEAALSKIVGLIRAGELKPGGVVNEKDLAKRFGMSRGPVREAVRQLEGRKLVTREAYQRARVIELNLSQVREIFELRECLEGMACRLATLRMSDEALADLVAEVEKAKKPEDYSLVFTNYAFNFHETIVNACGNSRIQQILCAELYDMVRLYRWTFNILPARHGPGVREHWQICRAMMARDEDLAESLMRAHVQHVMRLVEFGS